MARKKSSEEERILYYRQALKNKKYPLLTLDPGWHELFPDHRKTKTIRQLEKRLNKLIKKQGQTNNDIKDYEKARKVIMNNILANMTDGHEQDSPIRAKKQDENQRLLNELDEKLQEAFELEELLPRQIQEANEELLIECMRECYDELMHNTAQIDRLEEWIQETREELKERILQKQDMEMRNTQTYKYMHRLLGSEVMEVFDREHKVWKGNMEENL